MDIEQLKRQIDLWNKYIEANKCAIKGYKKENKIYRKKIANYEEKLKALKEI